MVSPFFSLVFHCFLVSIISQRICGFLGSNFLLILTANLDFKLSSASSCVKGVQIELLYQPERGTPFANNRQVKVLNHRKKKK